MFDIEFYEDANGHSDIRDFLEGLRAQMASSKDARVQFEQVSFYIQLLQDNGTRLSRNIVKPIVEDIWELRPGNNRVFFFYHRENTYVLLHHFRKKTQATPQREMKQALRERDDYLERKGK